MAKRIVTTALFAFLASILSTDSARAQLVPFGDSSFGPQFYDHATGKVVVVTEAGDSAIYNTVESSLTNSGYRIATKGEALSAVTSYRASLRLARALATADFPTLFPGGGYICTVGGASAGTCYDALFDDSLTGSDPQAVGLVRYGYGQLPSRPLSEPITIFDDKQDRTAIPNSGGGLDPNNQVLGVMLTSENSAACADTTIRHMDFDCDDIDEKIIWRRASGVWYIRYSRSVLVSTHQWGLNGDVPIVGDYDGDGLPDLVVWRPANGTWYIRPSASGIASANVIVRQFGLPGDRALRGDYDGDGTFDFAVWRPANGNFYYIRSSDGQVRVEQWGLAGDVPLTAGAQ